MSTTYKFPDESNVTPTGCTKVALVPVPLTLPCELLPAMVVTTPAEVILRIRKVYESAT